MSEHQGQNAPHAPLTRMGYGLTTIFLGTLAVGILGTFVFSASGCLITSAIRCFSISRDLIGLILLASKMWALPALIVALLVVMVVQIRGFVVWWNVLVAAFMAMFGSSVLALAPASVVEPGVLCIASLFLFMGVQISLLINNRFGKSST